MYIHTHYQVKNLVNFKFPGEDGLASMSKFEYCPFNSSTSHLISKLKIFTCIYEYKLYFEDLGKS